MQVSVDSLLQNPRGLDISKYVKQQSQRLLPSLIHYVVSQPNIMLHNQRQCYLYPFRAAQTLILQDISKLLFRKNTQGKYIYLDQLFAYLARPANSTSSGYFERVAIRLLNLSPEFLDYLKEREHLCELMCAGVRDECICGLLTAILIKDSLGVYVYFKRELVRRITAKALAAQDVEFFQGMNSIVEGLLLGKDTMDKTEVLACLSCQEFVDVMMLKLSGYNSRLTETVISILLQLMQGNQSKVTVGHEQLKAAIVRRLDILNELFQEYEQSQEFGKSLPRAVYTLLRFFVSGIQLGMFQGQSIARDCCRRLLLYTLILSSTTVMHVLLLRLLRHLLSNQLYNSVLFSELSLVKFLWNAYDKGAASGKATCLAVFKILETNERAKTEPEWREIQQVMKRRKEVVDREKIRSMERIEESKKEEDRKEQDNKENTGSAASDKQ